jgi:hypothetical protein
MAEDDPRMASGAGWGDHVVLAGENARSKGRCMGGLA